MKQKEINERARKIATEFMKRKYNKDIAVKESIVVNGHNCEEHGLHGLTIEVWQKHMEVMHKDAL